MMTVKIIAEPSLPTYSFSNTAHMACINQPYFSSHFLHFCVGPDLREGLCCLKIKYRWPENCDFENGDVLRYLFLEGLVNRAIGGRKPNSTHYMTIWH